VIAPLDRTSMTQLHGAASEPAVATKAGICVCPCSYAGHAGVCTVKIAPGASYRRATIMGQGPRQVTVCAPCWQAINGEATPREGSR
jgi:hypothetical protein